MHLLDARRGTGRDPDFKIVSAEQGGDPAALAPGQGDHDHAALMGRLHGMNDIVRFAAGADREQHIAFLAKRPDLFAIDLGILIVIGNGRQGR